MNTLQSSHTPGGGGKLKSENALEVRGLNYFAYYTIPHKLCGTVNVLESGI